MVKPKTMPLIPLKEGLLIQWRGREEDYLLHIHENKEPENPRIQLPYDDVLGIFHERYAPGDPEYDHGTPGAFWTNFADRNLSEKLAQAIAESKHMPVAKDPAGALTAALKLAEYGDPGPLKDLAEPFALCLPVYLYDVKRLSLLGEVVAAPEKKPAGWCWMSKDDALSLPGTREENWQEMASRYMEKSIAAYDDYVQGYNWWCQLLVIRDGKWANYRNLSGFYGRDLVSAGIPEEVRFGLETALESGRYKLGRARTRTITEYDMEEK